MHKLVILIEPLTDWQAFEDAWPDFLHQAEVMPGLRREASSRVEKFLYGKMSIHQIHELYFDSLQEAQQAMASSPGQLAGKLLQRMTGGKMTLFLADCREDDIENLRRYPTAGSESSGQPTDEPT